MSYNPTICGAVLLLAGLAARAGEPHLAVDAIDAATGRNLDGVVCWLVRPGSDAAYARFEGRPDSRQPESRAGDTLHVYRRGYELRTMTLAQANARVRVRLRACTGACSVTLEGAGSEAASLAFEILVRLPGGGRDSYTVRARGPGCSVVVPHGLTTQALVTAGPGLVWPPTVALEPGKTRTLRYEAPRVLAVRRPASLRIEATRVEVVPDRLWVPDAPPARIDAWRWRLNSPGWLRAPVVAGAGSVVVTPDVPFHLFASVGGQGIYRHVPHRALALDLTRPFAARRLADRPVVDGAPVPAGTWIAPGRLDLYAIASLAELAASLAGCVYQCGPLDERWVPLSFPAAPWLTAWHRHRGLAHLRWDGNSRASGRSYRGRVVLEVPRGHSASGHVSLFPTWKGTGAIQAVPPDRMLRRPIKHQRAVSFVGLVPGRYAISMQLTWTRTGVERTWRVERTLELDVPASRDGRGAVVRRQLPAR